MFSNYQYCTWYRLLTPPESTLVIQLSQHKQFSELTQMITQTARPLTMLSPYIKHLPQTQADPAITVCFWNAGQPQANTRNNRKFSSLKDFALYLQGAHYPVIIPTAATKYPGNLRSHGPLSWISHQARRFIYPQQRQRHNLTKAYQDYLDLKQELKSSGLSPKIIRHSGRQQKIFCQLQEDDPWGSYARSSRCWKDQTKKRHQYSSNG